VRGEAGGAVPVELFAEIADALLTLRWISSACGA